MVRRSHTRPHMSQWVALLLIALILSHIPLGTPAALAQSNAQTTVEWGQPQNITRNNIRSLQPYVAIDRNNHSHIIYLSIDGDSGTLRYTNNVAGSFSSPQTIATGITANRDPYVAMKIDQDNVIHVVYAQPAGDRAAYYRRGTLNGAAVTWAAPQQLSSGGDVRTFALHLAIDNNRNVHIVWIDNRCGVGRYNVYYRVRRADGSLSPISQPRPDCAEFQNRPQITITEDGKPHIIFIGGRELYYGQLENGRWVIQNFSNSPNINSLNPTIETDGRNLYVAWDEGVNNHDILFRRSTNGGQTWSNIVDLSGSGASFASFPNAAWSSGAQRLYIAWADNLNGAGGTTEIYYREFDPAANSFTPARRLTNLVNAGVLPVISAGPSRVSIAWQDNAPGPWQVYYMTGQTRGGCTGTLVLENGAETTKNTTLNGVVTPNGCTPNEMAVSVGSPPAATAPRMPYSTNVSVPVPDAACDTRVYVQLFERGATGAPAQASIKVDNRVDAFVQAINPFASNLPPTYTPPSTQGVRIQAAPGATTGGHPAYTRVRQFYLGISSAEDCTGLKHFAIDESIRGDIPPTGFMSAVPLPGPAAPGKREFTVTITDTMNNQARFPSASQKFELIYDPPNISTAPNATDGGGLPVLAQGGSVAADQVNSIMRTLTFNNISVSDNLYGQAENLPAGRQFWGVWVANSREDNAQNSPNLRWIPVEVPNPNASFSITWNLFAGLDYGGDRTRTGAYYVYVRFLDGAGNPSRDFLKVQVNLAEGYDVPTMYMPMIGR